MDINNRWSKYLSSVNTNVFTSKNQESESEDDEDDDQYVSQVFNPSSLYISTKSKIAYLNININLKELFWNLPIINYMVQTNGIIKKQIKYISENIEEKEYMENRIKTEYEDKNIYCENIPIKCVDSVHKRVLFKDIRKISIGLTSKDILIQRCKKKSAFYNCFVIIYRYQKSPNDVFKEYHIKVFNTGKLKIPGVQNEEIFNSILEFVLKSFQPFFQEKVEYAKESDTVLINSNFNSGFYINQESLFKILKCKYKIDCIYDPCNNYPGIHCKYYYNYLDEDNYSGQKLNNFTIKEQKKSKDNVTVSFMIFRTGSILISGKFEEPLLNKVFEFIKNILNIEYENICINNKTTDNIYITSMNKNISHQEKTNVNKKRKNKKKTISIKLL